MDTGKGSDAARGSCGRFRKSRCQSRPGLPARRRRLRGLRGLRGDCVPAPAAASAFAFAACARRTPSPGCVSTPSTRARCRRFRSGRQTARAPALRLPSGASLLTGASARASSRSRPPRPPRRRRRWPSRSPSLVVPSAGTESAKPRPRRLTGRRGSVALGARTVRRPSPRSARSVRCARSACAGADGCPARPRAGVALPRAPSRGGRLSRASRPSRPSPRPPRPSAERPSRPSRPPRPPRSPRSPRSARSPRRPSGRASRLSACALAPPPLCAGCGTGAGAGLAPPNSFLTQPKKPLPAAGAAAATGRRAPCGDRCRRRRCGRRRCRRRRGRLVGQHALDHRLLLGLGLLATRDADLVVRLLDHRVAGLQAFQARVVVAQPLELVVRRLEVLVRAPAAR